MQVVDALLVVDRAVRSGPVGVGRAVLGHVQRQPGVLPPQAHQQGAQALGVDGPAHVGVGAGQVRGLHLLGAHPRAGAGLGGPAAHQGRGVVVQAEGVQGLVDDLQVALAHEGPVGDRGGVGEDVGGVLPGQGRAEEDPVHDPVELADSVGVLGAVALGHEVPQVQGEGDVGARSRGAHRPRREAVGEVQVVRGGQRRRRVGDPGGVDAGRVAEVRRAPGLVEGDDHGEAVAQALRDHAGVLPEALGGAPVGPPPDVTEGLGQVPVVQRGGGGDAGVEEGVDEAVVEGQARLVDRPEGVGGDLRGDARPRDREAVGPQAQALHQRDVLRPPVVVVVGDVAGVAADDLAGGVAEGVPDRGGAPVLGDRALDLVGGGGRAPHEAGGEGGHGCSSARGRSRSSSAGAPVAPTTVLPQPGAAQ